MKNCWYEGDDGKINFKKSVCKNCFFNEEFEQDADSDVTIKNWDEYDYNWKLKISKSKFYCKFCKKIIRIAYVMHMRDNHNVRIDVK